jgi:SOS-response transcriptional repressor LexA
MDDPAIDSIARFVAEKVRELGSKEKFAEVAGVNPRSVYKYVNGEAKPRHASIAKMARAFGVSEAAVYGWGDSADAPAPMEIDFVPVPYFDVRVAGSPGGTVENVLKVKSYLAFNRDWIHHQGNPDNMAVYRVVGESMSEIIPDGSVVLVDENRREPVSGKIFVVRHNGELKIKELRRDKQGRLFLVSRGLSLPEEEIRPDDRFDILARAIWVGYTLP